MESNFPAKLLILLVDRLAKFFTRMNIPCESLFSEYFKGELFFLYQLLRGPNYGKEIDYKEYEILKRQSIEQYISDCDIVMFKRLIDVCNDINEPDGHTNWQIREGLTIAFELFLSKDCYVDAVNIT